MANLGPLEDGPARASLLVPPVSKDCQVADEVVSWALSFAFRPAEDATLGLDSAGMPERPALRSFLGRASWVLEAWMDRAWDRDRRVVDEAIAFHVDSLKGWCSLRRREERFLLVPVHRMVDVQVDNLVRLVSVDRLLTPHPLSRPPLDRVRAADVLGVSR